ncbi:hypothetical protein MPF19_18660 [Polaribacter sp. Z014]|uniref:DUF3800 domain-containing protein n=1 Tax=Polaribacter sp. Z014 TaxID=2927126 RepID=UPI00202135D2|nr:hypothetical protein [Polaribacter sp. Z014]MCL7765446.1 hypothetical protein [Polaribacter sp. Z014]
MITTSKKINYFYIDESGSINNDSDIFIHGCIKTDSPNTISTALEKLKKELIDSLYYEEFAERIKKEGFHATENNMDMRADVYKLLPLLDYRSYFVILNKKTDYFKSLQNKEEHEIFSFCLRKLLMDRIIKNKGDKNIFIFETIKISKKPLITILKEIFDNLDKDHDCEYKIVGKDELNMGIIDYLNFVFHHLLTSEKIMNRMKQNFDILAPKIAVINLLHSNIYLSRKKKAEFQINLDNLNKQFSEQPR